MAPNGRALSVGICGATGAVGIEIISVLAARDIPIKRLVLFASARSAGKLVSTPYGEIVIDMFSVDKASTLDYVFLAVSGDFSLNYAKKLASIPNGPVVIDNSSAYRYDPTVPLVIPEVNGHVLRKTETAERPRLIANPNCTTAIAAMALWPLHCEFGIKRMIVSTYQAASGAGAEGMQELKDGARAVLNEQTPQQKVFAYPLPFNLIPHIDKFQENGYTKEEMKVTWETRKIFDEPSMQVSCTAVRVPILRAHSEAITIETERPIDPHSALNVLRQAEGVDVEDEPSELKYPMPLHASKKFNIEVGRIRQSLVFEKHGIELFVSGDQLLRGAALNAVLIAEWMEDSSKKAAFSKAASNKCLSRMCNATKCPTVWVAAAALSVGIVLGALLRPRK